MIYNKNNILLYNVYNIIIIQHYYNTYIMPLVRAFFFYISVNISDPIVICIVAL